MSAPSRKRRRPWVPFVVVIGVIVVLVGAFLIADTIVRGVAEDRVASQIEQSLPDGVDADVAVSIGGASVIAQYLTGTFEHVDLRAPGASVDGIPLDVRVSADAVPLDPKQTIGRVVATIRIDADGAAALAKTAGLPGTLTLGDDEVGYAGEATVLGFTIPYDFSVAPTTTAERVNLMPTSVNVDTGLFGVIDLRALVTGFLQGDPPSICVAQYLPEGVDLDRLAVTPQVATATLTSTTLRLDEASLQTLGSCG
ncbi:DUF2993 domain-containing protein [Plantibacter sp. VKM Ac-2880]|uniref:LmeA family phospholipid-binding protein n=1 Tax=Plantibacter sp. VKM Ac-2880 TaxID=2783827 RepID=UPI0018904BC0|nr:DUF2993 domain-containing protein [Plantibacter sp. VKM Ac-2880]MBF4569715.1 DUF2993 domain-containing protein [Plantibacter sp. VKM Ac-2880]